MAEWILYAAGRKSRDQRTTRANWKSLCPTSFGTVRRILVEVEPWQQGARLVELARELLGRVLLDLVRLAVVHIDAPVGGVLVAPLGADHDMLSNHWVQREPRGHKVLAQAVGARAVEVADAELVRRI